MTSKIRVALADFCDHFHIDIDIVRDFAEFGLCKAVVREDEVEIETQDIRRLKRIICLYQALGINKEGIEVILDMGERLSELQNEVEMQQNEIERLRRVLSDEEPETLRQRGLLIEIKDGF